MVGETILAPRPWWLQWLPSWSWVTLSPNVYHPKGTDLAQCPAFIVHEGTHLRQQASGSLLWWYLRYVFSRSFRLAMEAEAFACQAAFEAAYYAGTLTSQNTLDYAAGALCGRTYLWAAPSFAEARTSLQGQLGQLSPENQARLTAAVKAAKAGQTLEP